MTGPRIETYVPDVLAQMPCFSLRLRQGRTSLAEYRPDAPLYPPIWSCFRQISKGAGGSWALSSRGLPVPLTQRLR